jgi:hypothetical protein
MPQRVTRSAAVAACAVLALAVAGCSGSDDGVAASGSPSPTPTASPTPTVEIPDVPVPERPADEHTSDGAVAFTKYVVEVINRMYVTGDTESLMAISTPDCPTCLRMKKDIDLVYARGHQLRGGRTTLIETGHVIIADDVLPSVPSLVDFGAVEELSPEGVVVATLPAMKEQAQVWDLDWANGKWLFVDLRGGPE